MSFRALIIFALEAQTAAKVFDRWSGSPSYFLPRIERLLQAIEVINLELSLSECVPDVGILRIDGDDPPAQFYDCRLVIRLFGCFELETQMS